jgi:diaminopimelate decarboxylase
MSYMMETTRMLLEICAMLKEELGIACEFINIGGGFGIPYVPGQKEINLELMAKQIVGLLERFEKVHGFRPALLTECGRYVTGPHGVLVSRVINQKFTYQRHVGVDTGMPALMRHAIYGVYHHVDILDAKGRPRGGRRQRMNVVGSICENCDRLATNRLLPTNTWEGDIVVTHDTGAHGLAMGFNYNGRLRPQELLLRDDGSVELIRRAETERDLFATLEFSSHKWKPR